MAGAAGRTPLTELRAVVYAKSHPIQPRRRQLSAHHPDSGAGCLRAPRARVWPPAALGRQARDSPAPCAPPPPPRSRRSRRRCSSRRPPPPPRRRAPRSPRAPCARGAGRSPTQTGRSRCPRACPAMRWRTCARRGPWATLCSGARAQRLRAVCAHSRAPRRARTRRARAPAPRPRGGGAAAAAAASQVWRARGALGRAGAALELLGGVAPPARPRRRRRHRHHRAAPARRRRRGARQPERA